jgi:hypothetical protein
MIPSIRQAYNEQFTEEKYKAYLLGLQKLYPGQLDFRVAETPVFVPKAFTEKMLVACESIIDVVITPEYKQQSERAVPEHLRVPSQDAHPQFICFDFGVCKNVSGELEPQLIEMQGFPSLFAWQAVLPKIHSENFWWPEGYSPYLNGLSEADYIELLRKIIVADEDPQNVVLLEVLPEQQKTRVDFHATRDLVGVDTLSLTELQAEENRLFYLKDHQKIPVNRIYNRVIFDDLDQQPEAIRQKGKFFQQPLQVKWVPHPNWFYQLSKFTLPFIQHPYVPETDFLADLKSVPTDLENYVVKPLFSFAGQGVIIDVTEAALHEIKDPKNWIIQRKVQYADAIVTPDENAKAEIRLFYFWEDGAPRPIAVNNLSRISKGKMVGVRYNKDKSWVGGSFCLFEQ